MNAGYIGAIGPDKGIRYLCDAWKILAYDDKTLYFYGKDSERNKFYINDQMRFSPAKHVVMGGFDDLREPFSHFQVYIQPSVTEGFGIPVLEAMMHGKTVICSDGAGVHELIEHGVNGLTFRKRDMYELSNMLNTVMRNPEWAREMGVKAHGAAKRFTWDVIMDNYKYAYSTLFKEDEV
jgi:glycosyltransferase involved in cell wall biosynthesis